MLKLQQFSKQIDEFMFYCDTKGLSKKTMSSYEQTLRLFSRFISDKYNVEDGKAVTEQMLRQYVKSLQERGKYTVVSDSNSKRYNQPDNRKDLGKRVSTSTINNYIRNIKVFFSFMKEQKYTRINVTEKVKQIKVARKAQDFISDNDFLSLLKNIDTSKFHEYRDYTIIQLIFDTGMRLGECLKISYDDIDVNNRTILLQAENTKGKKDRYVYFSQYMQKELRRWIQYKDRYKDSDYLFCTIKGTPMNVGVFESNFKTYVKRIGLDEAHPHQLRNNFAKRFLMSGGDIFTLSKILGHSSVTVTEKAYLDLNDDDIRQNYQKFSPLSKLKGNR
jgi:integrase/recombinase XerD